MKAKFVITCDVDLGKCLVAKRDTVDQKECVRQGYNSVRIHQTSTYAVFDPSRITIKEWRLAESNTLCVPPGAPKKSQQVPKHKGEPCGSPQQALAILAEALQASPCKKLNASTDMGPLYKKHQGLRKAIGNGGLKGFCEKHEELVWDKKFATVSLKKINRNIEAILKKPKETAVDVLTAEILASPTKLLNAPLDMPKLYKKHSFLKQALGSGGVKGFCAKHPSFKWHQASMTVSLTQMVTSTAPQSSPLYQPGEAATLLLAKALGF